MNTKKDQKQKKYYPVFPSTGIGWVIFVFSLIFLYLLCLFVLPIRPPTIHHLTPENIVIPENIETPLIEEAKKSDDNIVLMNSNLLIENNNKSQTFYFAFRNEYKTGKDFNCRIYCYNSSNTNISSLDNLNFNYFYELHLETNEIIVLPFNIKLENTKESLNYYCRIEFDINGSKYASKNFFIEVENS